MPDEKMFRSLMENLITVLCYDDEYGRQVAQMLDPAMMEGEYRTIAERAIAYWNKYNTAPKEHTADLMADIIEDEGSKKSKTYMRIIESMAHLAESMNTQFILEQLRQFNRLQAIKSAILQSAEKLQQNQHMAVPEVEEMWNTLLRQNEVSFEPGMVLGEVDHIIDYMNKHYNEFQTGVKHLDQKRMVPARGQVLLGLAAFGRGKSWFLVSCGKAALMQRQKVLHISLEMSEEEVIIRYYMALFGIAKWPDQQTQTKLITHPDNPYALEDLRQISFQPEFNFQEMKIPDEIKSRLAAYPGRYSGLIVKRFSPRTLTMNGLRAYLDLLHQTENFVPDLVCLDYIGITKTDVDNQRVTLGRNMEEFRGIMVDRNMAGVTVHQVQRAGLEAEMVQAIHVAEDWSLLATADAAFTYTSSMTEHEFGLARLYAEKVRGEKDKFVLLITQNYGIGQFCIDSMVLSKSYPRILKEISGGLDKRERSTRDKKKKEE